VPPFTARGDQLWTIRATLLIRRTLASYLMVCNVNELVFTFVAL
jgi:hypothetical protein